MEYNWRANSYYDSPESQENSNQDNSPNKINKFAKILFLIVTIIFILYKQPINQNNPNIQNIPESPYKTHNDLKKPKQEIIPDKELNIARASFQQFIFKDAFDATKNLPYNLFIPEFIPQNAKTAKNKSVKRTIIPQKFNASKV